MQVDRKESEQGTDRFRSYGYGQGAGVPPPNIPSRAGKEMNWGTLRPQIFIAIICATLFSIVALFVGGALDAVEIVTAVIGGLFGLLGGVSLKVLENE